MAPIHILSTMAHHGDRPLFGKFLNQPEGELLPTVFDELVFSVEAITFKKLLFVEDVELEAGDFSRALVIKQLLARPKIGHPDIVCRLS